MSSSNALLVKADILFGLDADMFTLAVADVFGQKMLAEHADKDADLDVKPPDKFIVGSKWSVFKEGFETYLNSQKGCGNILLSYVIRVLDVVNPLEMYETQHEKVIKTVPLIGPDFVMDNGNVYDLLKGLILAGPAWPWMQEHDIIMMGARHGSPWWLTMKETV